jgi:hypothetical protein
MNFMSQKGPKWIELFVPKHPNIVESGITIVMIVDIIA